MNPEDGYWTSRYIGSLIYEGEPGEEILSGIQTADGFIEWRGSAANSQMQYFLRDHLGSVRVIAADRNTVISRSDYLPFGVKMTGNGLCGEISSARSSYFGFSGKENEMWDGLDVMSGNTPHWLKGERYQHFGARAYDPVTCIFMQIDPMAEKYYGLTPYHYCAGNPVMLVDPDGEIPFLANVVAGVVSASVDFGMQVAANMISGKTFTEAVKNVDYVDVAMSGLEGALTMGASTARKMAVKGVTIAISSTINYSTEKGASINDPSTAVAEATIGALTDGLGKGAKVNLPSKSANKEVKAARAASHAKGKEFSSESAKSVASDTRKTNQTKKEVSSGIEKGSEGGIGKVVDKTASELLKAIKENFDLTPKGIIASLNLRQPIFSKTAAYGHFGYCA